MASIITLIAGALLVTWILSTLRGYRHYYAIARRMSLPIVISPVSPMQMAWQLFALVFLPLINRLPRQWTDSWLPLSLIPNHWIYGYAPFRRMQHDTFVSVSSSDVIIHTCDPAVSAQVLANENRDIMFKPPELIEIVNCYGPSLPGVNGERAHAYRKIFMPSMSESTNRGVWKSTLQNEETMLQHYGGPGRMTNAYTSLSEMTLKIMCQVCYGKDLDADQSVHANCEMSFGAALTAVINGAFEYLVTPSLLLNWSPLRAQKEARIAFHDFKEYMTTMWAHEREAQRQEVTAPRDLNLLGSIVANTGDPKQTLSHSAPASEPVLSTDSAFGNTFMFLVAGHETTANTVNYALSLLACHREIQRRVQADVDSIVGSTKPQEWQYEQLFPKLRSSWVGAVMKETLRLWTVVPIIPKKVQRDTVLKINQQPVAIPRDTFIYINSAASHRNPTYWPHELSAIPPAGSKERMPYPVSAFNPSQWLEGKPGAGSQEVKLFEPTSHSFLPFSEGPRKCMGWRFAEVEMVTILTRLLWEFDIDLDVDPGDEAAWTRAREDAAALLTDITIRIALRPVKTVPLRLTRRSKH